MYYEHTLDAQGRLVDIFWSTIEQQEKIARFGGCIQMDTTVFTNRCQYKVQLDNRKMELARLESIPTVVV